MEWPFGKNNTEKKPDTEIETETEKTIEDLSSSDIEQIKKITTGIGDVLPEQISDSHMQDVIDTIESDHKLNKIWRNEKGEIAGFVAFEDFTPNEAYAKYFATDGNMNENPFQAIPDLINEARENGYKKIGFHGWNKKLNKALTHFGFQKTQTESLGGYNIDHYEIDLTKEIPQDTSKIEESFEHKYILKITNELNKTLETLKQEQKQKVERKFTEIITEIDLTEKQKIILKLKIARYLQRHESIHVPTLVDALEETPKYLDKDKGGFDRLFKIHEQKTLEKIAEIRRRKAEQTGDEEFNPYEALFQTESGEYYMSRLLNMPHLEEESQYMDHCVGTSDSYINKMKRGDVEILSFRTTPKYDNETGKTTGDEPIITIEYNVRTKTIEQIKKAHDNYLKPDDPYFKDVMESLKKLRTTELDNGKNREFQKINESELENIKVEDYNLYTENGPVHFRDYDLDSNVFILKFGKMSFDEKTPKTDQVKILKLLANIDVEPTEIATSQSEVNENTKIYNGELYPNIFKELPDTIEKIYTNFPEKISEVYIKEIEIPNEPKTPEQHEKELAEGGYQIDRYGKDILSKANLKERAGEKIKLIIASNKSLGFPQGATRAESKERAQQLGIARQNLPAIVGPELRKKYADQPNGEYILIDMESITGGGYQFVFNVSRYVSASILVANFGGAGYGYGAEVRWAFSQI